MIVNKVSSHYSKALFKLGSSPDELKSHLTQLKKIVQLSGEGTDLGSLLYLPTIGKEEKKKTLKEILTGKIEENLIQFLILLVDKDRIQFLPAIVQTYEQLVKRELGIVVARVTTAVPIEEEIREKIYQKLKAAYPKNQIEIDTKIDPEIVGGMVININNHMFDNSIRHRLDKFKKELYQMKV